MFGHAELMTGETSSRKLEKEVWSSEESSWLGKYGNMIIEMLVEVRKERALR